ncbi:MAG: hypothetical protein JWN73_4423 [Betaproteobacteria bacterium]|nr:hypothetical protein [Betaproteobacteria bacterium]
MHKPLSARQERFVHEYLLDHNASAAARRAGYSGKTRGAQACALMRNPLVQERIALATADRYAELKINAFDILKARAREAFFDPGVLLDGDGKPLPLHELSAETRTVLSLSYDMKGNVRIRQAARTSAFAMLEKRYLEMLRLQTAVFGRDEDEDEAPHPAQPATRAVQRIELAPNWNVPPASAEAAEPVDAVAQAAAAIEQAEAVKGGTAPIAPPEHPALVIASAEAASSEPDSDAPPSPYEPGYDFTKDPDAGYGGGRFKAWNKYHAEKRQAEQQAREAAAAGIAPNTRIAPGKKVMPRMEPGYNPPWLRDNRPKFAIGAGEFYFSGEEPWEND